MQPISTVKTNTKAHHLQTMPSYSSDSDDKPSSSSTVHLFGRKRPLHTVLGGGKVANVILWRNKHLSAAILVAASAIWFLFEIVEYHFLTLLCHLSITTMLAVFIWTNGATLLNRSPPKIPDTILSEAVFRDVALTFHSKLSAFISILYDVACGKDLKLLILTIASLWMLSVIGSYVSFLNLLYFGFVSIQILPALYERYEDEVDELAGRGTRDMMKLYRKFDSKVLDKIPRGPVKQKKSK